MTGRSASSGTARVGETLTASVWDIADTDGLSGAMFVYQWVSNDGSADTDIAGAAVALLAVATGDGYRAVAASAGVDVFDNDRAAAEAPAPAETVLWGADTEVVDLGGGSAGAEDADRFTNTGVIRGRNLTPRIMGSQQVGSPIGVETASRITSAKHGLRATALHSAGRSRSMRPIWEAKRPTSTARRSYVPVEEVLVKLSSLALVIVPPARSAPRFLNKPMRTRYRASWPIMPHLTPRSIQTIPKPTRECLSSIRASVTASASTSMRWPAQLASNHFGPLSSVDTTAPTTI